MTLGDYLKARKEFRDKHYMETEMTPEERYVPDNDLPQATLDWHEHASKRKDMTIDKIRRDVQVIRDLAKDAEAAHTMEDALYEGFIRHIAENGNERDARLAMEVLRTKDIDFPRYVSDIGVRDE